MMNNNNTDIYLAARNSVVFQVEEDLHCLKFDGEDVPVILDIICPCDVFLQDGQIKQTLLLNNEGIPFADIYIGREAESYFILGYWPNTAELIEWINSNLPEKFDYEVFDLDAMYKSITVEGPYAWELTARVINSDIMGIPYLGVMQIENKYVFRAGITGEYGYHILVKNEDFESFQNKLLFEGKSFELMESNEAVKSLCILESFFFDIKHEGTYNLNPMELQMQWRLSRQKSSYPGAGAIMKIKNEGWERRLTCFSSAGLIEKDESIICDGIEIGKVLNCAYSPLRQEYVGKALINKPYWHAGISHYSVGQHQISTISAPAVLYKSLKINPYKDSFLSDNIDDDEI